MTFVVQIPAFYKINDKDLHLIKKQNLFISKENLPLPNDFIETTSNPKDYRV